MISHPRGLPGMPRCAHATLAVSRASWAASAQSSNRPWWRTSAPSTCGAGARSADSTSPRGTPELTSPSRRRSSPVGSPPGPTGRRVSARRWPWPAARCRTPRSTGPRGAHWPRRTDRRWWPRPATDPHPARGDRVGQRSGDHQLSGVDQGGVLSAQRPAPSARRRPLPATTSWVHRQRHASRRPLHDVLRDGGVARLRPRVGGDRQQRRLPTPARTHSAGRERRLGPECPRRGGAGRPAGESWVGFLPFALVFG